jgi:hypothetical protein
VALLFRYDDLWLGQVQPHAEGWRDWAVWAEPYMALRALGLDVDVLPPDRDLSPYALVVAPSLTIADDAVAASLSSPSRPAPPWCWARAAAPTDPTPACTTARPVRSPR